MSVYVFIKDFAGPAATIIASIAAAFVTISIQRQNQQLARDRLKLGLFHRRYEVYTATRDLLLIRASSRKSDASTDAELDRIYAKMAEVRFSCGPHAQAFVEEVRAIDKRWRHGQAQAANARDMPAGAEKIAAALAPSTPALEVMKALDQIGSAFLEDLRVEDAPTGNRWSSLRPRN